MNCTRISGVKSNLKPDNLRAPLQWIFFCYQTKPSLICFSKIHYGQKIKKVYNHLQKKFRRRRESRVKTSRKTEPLRAFSGKVHPVIATESTRKGKPKWRRLQKGPSIWPHCWGQIRWRHFILLPSVGLLNFLYGQDFPRKVPSGLLSKWFFLQQRKMFLNDTERILDHSLCLDFLLLSPLFTIKRLMSALPKMLGSRWDRFENTM